MMSGEIRVLYVDDEPMLLGVSKFFLEEEGAMVVDTLISAKEALIRLNTVRYDAIISDYQMPEMDGIRFLKALRTKGNTIPFIIFTGRGREEIVIEALNNGADFYLQKGGDPESQFAELAHKIRQAVQQRRAEASIRDLERREADILNFLPDATFAIDTNGVVIAWNRSMEMMTGVILSEILGKGNYEYAIPFYHERRPILIDLVLKDDPVTAGKYPAITRDGTTLFSEITIPHFNNGMGAEIWFTASPLYDTQGTIVGAIESIREITERKQAVEALAGSEKRFRELSDLLPQVVYEADTDGNLTYVNHIAFERFGYTEGEFRQGLNFLQMLAPNDRERGGAAFRAMLEGEGSTGIADEYQALRKDGSTFPISIYSSPVIVNGRITGLRGIIVDITERKKAEDCLVAANREYTGLLNQIQDVYYRSDTEGRVIKASQSWATLLGYEDISECLGRSIANDFYLNPADRKPFLEEIYRNGKVTDYEIQLRRKDGTLVPVATSSHLYYDPAGNILGVEGTFRDISEQKRQEQILSTQLTLGLALQSIRGMEETLDVCLNAAIEISGLDSGGIYLVDEKSGSIDLIVSRNLGDGFVKSVSHYTAGSVNAKMVMAGKPIYVQFSKTGIVHSPIQEREGLQQAAIIPILSSNRVIACLNITSHTVDEIPANARVSLETIAAQIGTAIERIRAEEALAESEQKYRNVVEDQTEFICRFLPDGIHVFVNDAYCRYFNRKREDIIGNRFRPRIPREDQERVARLIASLTPEHPVEVIDQRIIMPDGSIRWQRWSDRAIFHADGCLKEYQSVGRDITDRKLDEEALRESEEKFRSLAESSPDYIMRYDRQCRHTYMNPAALRVSGLTEDKIIGKTHRESGFDESQSLFWEEKITGVFETKKPYQTQFAWESVDGRVVLDWMLTPEFSLNGTVRSVLGVSRDITQLKKAEEELLKKNEELIASYEQISATEEELRQTLDQLTRNERNLRESEERYREFFTTSRDSVFITSPEGRFIDFNNALVEMFGFESREELFEVPVPSIYAHPEERSAFLHLIERDGYVKEYPMRLKQKDGTVIDTLITTVPVRNPDGSLKAFTGTIRDVTGLKRTSEDARKAHENLEASYEEITATEEELRQTLDQLTRNERNLRESEEKYRTVFENTGTAMVVVDENNIISLANNEFAYLSGFSKDDIEGKKSWTEFVVKVDLERMLAQHRLRRQNHEEALTHYEFRFVTKSGDIRTIYLSIDVIPGTKKSIASLLDITERKQAEELYRTIFENTGTAMIILEEDTTISHVNDKMEKIWGYSREEIEGRVKWPKLVAAEDLEKMLEYHRLRRTDPGSAPRNYEFRFVHKDGGLRHAALTAAMIPGTKKSVISLRDITERKRAEEELRESEERYRNVVDDQTEFICRFLPDGTHIFVNDAYCRYFNRKREDIIGHRFRPVIHPEDRENVAGHIASITPEHPVMDIDQRIIMPDGSTRWQRWSDRAIFDPNGRVIEYQSVGRDITEQKELEKEMDYREQELRQFSTSLAAANKKLTLLSGITRHDISNQLTVLRGFLRILEKKQPDTSFSEHFQNINTAAQRISSMIQFTKEYEAIGVYASAWQDVRTLVDTAAKEAPLGQVMVKNDLPAGTEVFAGPMIVKVFYNLMDNAVRYGGKITTIRFSVEERNGDLVIVCEDDGDGVPADEKEKIFERGFGKNTGLGLFLAREILDITGITISESGEPGTGARFELTVPEGSYRMNPDTNDVHWSNP